MEEAPKAKIWSRNQQYTQRSLGQLLGHTGNGLKVAWGRAALSSSQPLPFPDKVGSVGGVTDAPSLRIFSQDLRCGDKELRGL